MRCHAKRRQELRITSDYAANRRHVENERLCRRVAITGKEVAAVNKKRGRDITSALECNQRLPQFVNTPQRGTFCSQFCLRKYQCTAAVCWTTHTPETTGKA